MTYKYETAILRACPGRRVRDPQTLALLPPDGQRKPLNSYWLRRLRDGDVMRVAELAQELLTSAPLVDTVAEAIEEKNSRPTVRRKKDPQE
jgi:hypothetical protein